MILKEKFQNAYVSDSYSKQYENYQKITDEYALAFAIYLVNPYYDADSMSEIRGCFERFKENYKLVEESIKQMEDNIK